MAGKECIQWAKKILVQVVLTFFTPFISTQ